MPLGQKDFVQMLLFVFENERLHYVPQSTGTHTHTEEQRYMKMVMVLLKSKLHMVMTS